MNAEPDFLASAYLDGELTDEERRVAEADPAVMAEVAELRALRAALADTPPPSEAAREAAIAAAMAAYQASPMVAPAAATARPSRVVPFRRRPRYELWLGVAAAVLVIGLLGVVIAAGLRPGGDDDDAAEEVASAEIAADEPAEEAAVEPASESDRIAEAAPAPAEGATDDSSFDATMAAAEEPAEEAASEPADEPASESADAPADAMVMLDPASFFTFDTAPGATVPIETPEQLADAGAYLTEVEAEGRLGATPNTRCGPALARAEALDGAVVVPVLVMITDDGLVTAVTDDCEVVLEAQLQP